MEMSRLMPQVHQEINCLGGDPHVGEELHAEATSEGWMVSSVSHAA